MYLLQATINPLLPILSRAHPRNLSQQLRQRSRSRRSLMMRRFHLSDLFFFGNFSAQLDFIIKRNVKRLTSHDGCAGILHSKVGRVMMMVMMMVTVVMMVMMMIMKMMMMTIMTIIIIKHLLYFCARACLSLLPLLLSLFPH